MIETKRIFLTGGGTGGSATPLIAIAESLYRANRSVRLEFFWFGSETGPEKNLIENLNANSDLKIKYHSIANGKLRRYFSLKNVADIFKIFAGFIEAIYFILKYHPDIIISVGSYISVPIVWAGWLFRVPSLIHQQDFQPGLANKLMAPFSTAITVTFPKSVKDYNNKAVATGNLVRQEFSDLKIDRATARQKYGLNDNYPVVFVIGGGTGADYINDLVRRNLKNLTGFCQIIHVTGKNKNVEGYIDQPNYHSFEFLHIDGLIKAYTAADIVLTRGGMGVLSELSYLGKPAVVIPIPDSHQEENTAQLAGNLAAIVLDQNKLTDEMFLQTIKTLTGDKQQQINIGSNLRTTIKIDISGQVIEIINKIMKR